MRRSLAVTIRRNFNRICGKIRATYLQFPIEHVSIIDVCFSHHFQALEFVLLIDVISLFHCKYLMVLISQAYTLTKF